MKRSSLLGFVSGPLLTALLGLIIVPITTWVFSPDDVGRFNLFQTILSFGLLLSLLGLDRAYIREYHQSANQARLLRACSVPGALVLVCVLIPSLFFSECLSHWLYALPGATPVVLTGAALLIMYFARFLSLILRMQERGWAYSASQVLPKLLSLGLIVGVALLGWTADFLTLQLITLVSLLAVISSYAWSTRSDWKDALSEKVQWDDLKGLLAYGLPLAVSGLAYWGLTATSTLALRNWSTLDELAVYSVTSSFAGAALIFQSIFATVWAPTVYRWVAENVDMRRVDLVARRAGLAVCIIFVAVGLMSWVTTYLLPNHYREVQYLIACAIAPSLLYTLSEVTTVGITISRRTSWTIWITFAALLVNVGMSWLLVPGGGAAGAVLANAAAFSVFFILRTEVSAAVWRQFPRRKLYAFTGLMICLAVAVVLLRRELPYWYPLLWLLPVGPIAFAWKKDIYRGIFLLRSRMMRPI